MRRSLTLIASASIWTLLLAAFFATPTSAQTCRAQEIMTSQCTWFALDELKIDPAASKQAETEVTSTLVAGCSQGEYQMVLLRGNSLADRAVANLGKSKPDAAAVRRECAAQATRVGAR
jgi:hypothetical protein